MMFIGRKVDSISATLPAQATSIYATQIITLGINKVPCPFPNPPPQGRHGAHMVILPCPPTHPPHVHQVSLSLICATKNVGQASACIIKEEGVLRDVLEERMP